MTPKQPTTPEEAIWEIYSRVVSLETTIRGTPNTAEGGLVQSVQEVKALAVENKDAFIEQGKSLTWLQTRCRAFHGERNGIDAPKAQAPTGDGAESDNPLAKIPKGRIATLVVTVATFVSLVIYNLGMWLGWWTPPNPP